MMDSDRKVKKPVQYFQPSKAIENPEQNTDEILQWMDDYTQLICGDSPLPSKAISIRIEGRLLSLFQQKCQLSGIAYQTKIKTLMTEWLKET